MLLLLKLDKFYLLIEAEFHFWSEFEVVEGVDNVHVVDQVVHVRVDGRAEKQSFIFLIGANPA